MAAVIEMPKLSDTMEEGGVSQWLKKEGDAVAEGEPLLEIETDKATMEYESPEAGILLKILLPAGKKCALNTPIAVIGQKGENIDEILAASKGSAAPKKETSEAPAAAKATPAPAASKPAPSAPKQSPNPIAASSSSASGLASSSSASGLASSSSASGLASSNAGSQRIKASPLAKKMAQEKGISLGNIQGSGPQGRVIGRDITSARPGSSSFEPAAMPSGEDRVVPVSMMRATIAKRLLAAKNDAPHFYLTRSVNMTQMNQWRETLNANLKDETQKVSVNDLLILLVSKALTKHPEINASWQGEEIRQFGYVNMAFAVALPTGLVTPVIKNANHLGARTIAQQTKQLVQQAKSGANLDYTSGTFTISNLGMLGIEEFTAIINPPQSAILAVGSTIMTPVVQKNGQITAEPRMKMTMSCDHRVIDGAMGAQFLVTLASYLEQPMMALS